MILSPDEWVTDLGIDRRRFEAEAQKQWPDGVLIEVTDPERTDDVVMQVRRPGERLLQIFHEKDSKVISIEGDEAQSAATAVWVASLLPDDPGGRIWFCDEHFTGHVELRRGITLVELTSGWVDHNVEPPEFRHGADSGS